MKYLILLATIVGTFTFAQAQRFACVDVNQILESMDEYKAAQEELEQAAAQWKQEIEQKRDEIRGLYNKYQSELVLLSEDAKKQREDEILEKERLLREYQKAKFGQDGALFQKRKSLVKPIQDKVYEAIESYADKRGYDFIFDKSSATGMIFSSDKYDKTEDIIKSLN